MANKRGWPDWIKGIALYGLRPDGTLGLIMTDEAGNLRVVHMPHAHTHEDGGSDEIDVTGLSGVLRNLQKGKWSVYDKRANFPAGEEVGALGYATDERKLYRWDGSAWQPVLSMGGWRYFGPKSGFPTDAVEGDLAYATDEHNLYRYNGTSWEKVLTEDFTQLVNRLHAATHESGGDDEINVDGLHGELADPQTPKTHASTHQPGGSDALPTGTPSAITEGATGSEGSSTKFARADHVHQTPSEWTPKVHGNEKHSPDFLAVDGSVPMQGDLVSDYPDTFYLFRGFFIDSFTPGSKRAPVLGLHNALAFNIERGGSVSCSPSPTGGSVSNLFDGSYNYIYWANPSGSIVVEVVFHTYFQYDNTAFIHFRWPGHHATDFTVEYYDDTDGTWVQLASVSGWDKILWSKSFSSESHRVTRLRFTFTGFASGVFSISEIGMVSYKSWSGDYLLPIRGGDMYGDIDMNGNDIVSPGLVDGVDVSSHASRHHSGGADPIYWNQLAINGDPNLNGHKILNPEGASGGMMAGVKWVDAVVYDGNPPSSWMLLDLSGYVGDRRALCVFRIDRPNAANNRLYQIAPADAYDLATDSGYTLGPNSCWVKAGGYGYIISLTDSQGRVRIRSESAESTDKVRLLCYFTVT